MQIKSFSTPPNKIILAADARKFGPNMVRAVVRRLRELYGHALPAVQTVFVLTPDATSLPLRWFDDVVPKLKSEAETRLMAVLMKVGNLRFAKPQVIVDERRSLAVVAERINEFALHSGAGLVIIPTTRKFLAQRLVLGSFSASMLEASQVPILTIAYE